LKIISLKKPLQIGLCNKAEFAQNIFDTAKFLKGQGKVDQLKADYKSNVNSSFLQP
ncbi:hypothetical protein V2E37_16505, partial [Acinetobacter baumannii]